MAPAQITTVDVVLPLFGLCLLLIGVHTLRRRAKTTQLKGPARRSWIFGVSHFLSDLKDESSMLEDWAEQHGDVFCMPIALGMTQVVICDPKAIQHCYARETGVYVRSSSSKIFIRSTV
jgi:hypothetical protein